MLGDGRFNNGFLGQTWYRWLKCMWGLILVWGGCENIDKRFGLSFPKGILVKMIFWFLMHEFYKTVYASYTVKWIVVYVLIIFNKILVSLRRNLKIRGLCLFVKLWRDFCPPPPPLPPFPSGPKLIMTIQFADKTSVPFNGKTTHGVLRWIKSDLFVQIWVIFDFPCRLDLTEKVWWTTNWGSGLLGNWMPRRHIIQCFIKFCRHDPFAHWHFFRPYLTWFYWSGRSLKFKVTN